MIRTTFGLFSLALLSSFFPSSKGFSLSRLLLSSSNLEPCRNIKRKNCGCRNHRELGILLRVATDPTTATATVSEDKKKTRSYDFISVEEAEIHLQRERTLYESERSELQRLLDLQSQQLRDLAEGRLGKDTEGGNNRGDIGRNHLSRSRMVVHDSSVGVINSVKINRNKCNNKSDSNKKNADTMLRMELLEARFRDALIDNEELTRCLHDQHREYHFERAELEVQLREEQDRLDYIRDELHMERAHFETSRRMLERLLGEEQQKVHELEQELLMLMTREQIFSEQKRSLEQQQYRQEQVQKQQEEEEQLQRRRRIQVQVQERKLHEYNNSNNGDWSNRQRQEEIGMSVNPIGFAMNINDVQCPLFHTSI